ncbi:hypothetical protein [Thermococcus sp. JdF3]|uniref:hypothetical protein n=1 Tax=Thermococcus sp. JdF3 TaxID=1638258 RepID=UPI0019801B87|nr:hypothetical protein [Thermococcus sp. JdF3]
MIALFLSFLCGVLVSTTLLTALVGVFLVKLLDLKYNVFSTFRGNISFLVGELFGAGLWFFIWRNSYFEQWHSMWWVPVSLFVAFLVNAVRTSMDYKKSSEGT